MMTLTLSEIALAVGDMPVVEIWQNSNNITLTGLTLGHDVPEYSCAGEGHVIAAYGSDNITINDCKEMQNEKIN